MRENKLVYGIGFNDLGYSKINGKIPKWYNAWSNMIQRCYDEKCQIKNPTYIGCSVCDEWLTASNFKKWFDNNYIEGYFPDKDIIVDGNKVYSPETCRFVSRHINNLFTDSGRARGEWPIGVYYNKQAKKFRAQLAINGKQKHLGLYSTHEEAHEVYLVAKKAYCKEVADKHLADGRITQEIYEAVLRKAENLT